MNAIRALWYALSNLARSLNRLAATADAVCDQVEQRMPIVGPHSAAGELAGNHAPALVEAHAVEPAPEASAAGDAHRSNGRHRKPAAAA